MQDIKEASRVLEENITSIRTVAEWAEAMGYGNREKFSRAFRNQFGYRPKEVFQEIRIKKIQDYFKNFPEEKNYCIAVEFGFADEQGLYKFFKRNIGLIPIELRKKGSKKG